MKRFFAAVTSIRLAVVLIAYLAVTCVLATLVPQGLSAEDYRAMYPPVVALLVIGSGFGSFFGSVLFVVPAFALFANLSACTVKRLVRELGKKKGRRHGPDALHLGLMALVLGSVWSFSGYRQGSVVLAPGEGVRLPEGSTLRLDDFRFERYPDGRPLDWVSVVTIEKGGSRVMSGVEIRVNDPLRYGGMRIYQAGYDESPVVVLTTASGIDIRLAKGETRVIDGTSYRFAAFDRTAAVAAFDVGSGPEAATYDVAAGDRVGTLVLAGFEPRLASGLEAVSDPGYPLVLAAFALVAAGTALTFAQKLKEVS